MFQSCTYKIRYNIKEKNVKQLNVLYVQKHFIFILQIKKMHNICLCYYIYWGIIKVIFILNISFKGVQSCTLENNQVQYLLTKRYKII